MLPISYRFVTAGIIQRPSNYISGWRSFGNTIITQVRGGDYVVKTSNREYEIEDGAGFLIPPGVPTCVATPPDQRTDAVFCHLHCRIYECQGLFTVLKQPIIFPRETGARVGACNDALITWQEQGVSLQASVQVSAILAELVSIAIDNCPDLQTAWNDPVRQRLLPVLRYIQGHINVAIRRDDLARVAGMSVPHLHTLFTRAFGAAPMDMVIRERMQHARQLLHWTELSVAEVGAQCGFDDPYYFSRAFKRDEGIPPSRYRRQVRT